MDKNEKLIHRFKDVTGSVTPQELEIVSVSKKKYRSVVLCIKGNMNIPFAEIKLYSGNLAIAADPCFESAACFGKEIEARYNAHPALVKALEKLAILGNGDSHRNSTGNTIAIDALASLKDGE